MSERRFPVNLPPFPNASSPSERSSEIYLKLPDDNLRVIAETKYKIGLCYYMLNKFDEAIAALKDSSEYLNGVVEAEKRNEQSEKTLELIQDIESTRQDIALKIVEVQEAKDQVDGNARTFWRELC